MNTDNLILQAKARFEHAPARRVLKEKYEAKMVFAYNSGMFRAGPDLLTTLMSCPGNDAVILDLYENPVKIIVNELKSLSQQRWQEQMNAWLVEYETLNGRR